MITKWAEDIRLRWNNAMDYYREELYFDIEFQQYMQFKFYEQWMKLKSYANSKGIQIIGDIPIYVAMDSADAWAHPELFQLDQDNVPLGVGKRDWYPMVESGFFWGMYNRPYGYLPKVHTTDAVIMDYSTENWRVTNPGAYYTRRVTYAANRNVGPLTYENDYYLQDASYWRIKNITIDYTFPQELTRKIRIEKLKIYVSGDNIFTHSPLFKHTDMFDPETIGFGDSDYNDTTGGLGGVGQGYSYPMLKTWTIGLNVTF